MKSKRFLTGLGLVLAASFSAASSSHAVTLQEFDSVGQQRQGEIVAAVLKAYYNLYKGNPATAEKARCMRDLYKPRVEGAGPHLINLILSELDVARDDPNNTYTVESIIEGIINRECPTPPAKGSSDGRAKPRASGNRHK